MPDDVKCFMCAAFAVELDALKRELQDSKAEEARLFDLYDAEYETVDEVAVLLTEDQRPGEESIPDGVRAVLRQRNEARETASRCRHLLRTIAARGACPVCERDGGHAHDCALWAELCRESETTDHA